MNEFYVKDREIDEFNLRIHDSDGLPFVNNKGCTVLVTPPRFYYISKTSIGTNHKTYIGLFSTLWRP